MSACHRAAVLPLAMVTLALSATTDPLPGQSPSPTWTWVAPIEWRQTGRLAHPRLAEVSGVAPSQAHPGVLWVINDSGNPPDLLAVDSTGTLLGSIPLRDAPNTDWEEIALGPCGTATCLYIADTGDNRERRETVAMHRLVEPTPPTSEGVEPQSVETLRFRYPDGPHDVEAMGVLPDGTILLVTKGRSGGILAFRLPPRLWLAGGVATAERVDSLPITAALGMGRAVTGMAVSADGTTIMVKTYRDLFPFVLEEGRRFRTAATPTACDILGKEPQGEAVGWLPDGRVIMLSERGLLTEGTVFVGRCRP